MKPAISLEKPGPASAGLRTCGLVIACFFSIAFFSDFLAPYDYRAQSRREPNAPATAIHFRDEEGTFQLWPVIYKSDMADPLSQRYEEDRSTAFPLSFFVRGEPYRFLGLVPAELRLFGVQGVEAKDAPRINLLGTDALGRDRFSRLLGAIRFSLIVSPAGTLLACLIGTFLGTLSGYANRFVDTVLMGAADTMLALPALILILAARAAFPLELPPMRAAILLVLIFALTGWAEIARLSRSLVRSVREREYILAARSIGLSEPRILFRHVLPNITRPLITQATIMLPYFLLAEVALSFLGVGLQEPEPSLGNMLAAANDLTQLSAHPVLLLSPAIVIFLFTLGTRLIARRANA
jgi:peptide/nickel transport system permease protein